MKTARRILSMLLCLTMVLGMLPTTARAEWSEDGSFYHESGTCGTLTWSYDFQLLGSTYSGVLTIGGSGAMPNFTQVQYAPYAYCTSAPWGYASLGMPITEVVIGAGVTSIGDNAFYMAEDIKRVTFSNGLTEIGENAFYACTGLTTLYLPDSVREIGDNAFQACYNLISLRLPAGLTEWGTGAFAGLEIYYLTIPEGVQTIAQSAFSSCRNLTNVKIPGSVKTIGDFAFEWCTGLESVTFASGVEEIGQQAFYGCSALKELTLPDSITKIGVNAFTDCTGLETVKLPENRDLARLNSGIFARCTSLKAVEIPESVRYIASAFEGCTSLTSVTIPENVKEIYAFAFAGCTNLTEVIFMGDAPTVVEASSENASFDAETVTLYAKLSNKGWADSEAYDAENETWNGYRLKSPPTVADPDVYYLALSSLVYESPVVGQTIKGFLQSVGKWDTVWAESRKSSSKDILWSELFNDIGHWEIIAVENREVGTAEARGSGFSAAAFRNPDTNEIVISYEGSHPGVGDAFKEFWGNWDGDAFQDWIAHDAGMFIGLNKPQPSQALSFYERVKEATNANKEQITITGHSLGGGLADIVAARYGSPGVSFNSAQFLDVGYWYFPDAMSEHFEGADLFRFMDHANEGDWVVGDWHGEHIKPKVRHEEENNAFASAIWPSTHGLPSLIRRDENGSLRLTEAVNGQTQPSKHTTEVKQSLGMDFMRWVTLGTSGNNTIQCTNILQNKATAPVVGRQYAIYGGKGNDIITGALQSALTITSGDRISGGPGDDTLDGRQGDDRYYYHIGHDVDTIADISGDDELHIYGFNANEITINKTGNPEKIEVRCGDAVLVKIDKNVRDFMGETFGKFEIIIHPKDGTDPIKEDVSDYFNKKKYTTTGEVACPVDLEILDSTGRVVYTVDGDTEGTYYTEYGNFYVSLNEDGEYVKSFDLVEGYSVRVEGYDEGTMDIALSSLDGGVISEPVIITDVPVTASMTATFSETAEGDQVLLVDNDGDGTTDKTMALEVPPTCELNEDGSLTVTVQPHSSNPAGSVMLAVYQDGKMCGVDVKQTDWAQPVTLTTACPQGEGEVTVKLFKLDAEMKPYSQCWSTQITREET